MKLIPTYSKEQLPKGISYPTGASALSDAFAGALQYDHMESTFSWRDEFWVSSWRERVQSKGVVTLFSVEFSPSGPSSQWAVRVYAVPSNYVADARKALHELGLPGIRSELDKTSPDAYFSQQVFFDLSEKCLTATRPEKHVRQFSKHRGSIR